MRSVHRSMTVAAVSSLALVLSACGGGSDDGRAAAAAREDSDREITSTAATRRTRSCRRTPRRPAAATCSTSPRPSWCTTTTEDAAPENDIAESIETDDNQNFTVTLKAGYKFSDGTAVTASSFVDAWNFAAYGPNGYQGSYFFEPIEGYADLQCDPEGKAGENEDPCESSPPARGDERPRGRRRHDLHDQDLREGLEPAGPAGLHRLRAAPRGVLRRPGGLRPAPIAAGPYRSRSAPRTSRSC